MRRACMTLLAARWIAARSVNPAREIDVPLATKPHAFRLAAILVAGAALLSVESSAVAQGWSGTPWYVHCSDPPDCAPADEVYRQMLEDAGRWLDGLGFGPPELAQVEDWPEGALHATVSDSETINRENEPIGRYLADTRRLYLSSEHFFAMGQPGQSHEDKDYSVQESLPFVPVHELFHAIQRGYQPGNFPLWIKEGTANAVLNAYAEQFQQVGPPSTALTRYRCTNRAWRAPTPPGASGSSSAGSSAQPPRSPSSCPGTTTPRFFSPWSRRIRTFI